MVAADPLARRAPPESEAFRVLRRTRETDDTWTLVLEPPRGSFAFEPGQFTMLYAFGAGEVPISISGDPGRPEQLVHTVRAVGPTTRAICASPREGSLVVRAVRDNGLTRIDVEDTGVGLPPGWKLHDGRGTGLRNLASRLAAEFGDAAALNVGPREGGGVRATVTLPYAPS